MSYKTWKVSIQTGICTPPYAKFALLQNRTGGQGTYSVHTALRTKPDYSRNSWVTATPSSVFVYVNGDLFGAWLIRMTLSSSLLWATVRSMRMRAEVQYWSQERKWKLQVLKVKVCYLNNASSVLTAFLGWCHTDANLPEVEVASTQKVLVEFDFGALLSEIISHSCLDDQVQKLVFLRLKREKM